jgi:undecaprenyl-diphosphatase
VPAILAFTTTTSALLGGQSSDDVHRAVAQALVGAPRAVQAIVEFGSELGVLVLVLALLAQGRHARRWGAAGVGRLLAGGAGVVLTYLLSEILKTWHRQERPCQALPDLATVAACPPANDFSLPSNHAAVTAALAVALVFVAPRTGRWTWLVVLAVGTSRVLLGVHHLHDVGSGVLLGVVVVTAAVLALDAPGRWAVQATASRRDRGESA